MNIAVLSGKGGAGKTFVAVHAAAALKSSFYIDCDVEEPNGHLFLKPTIQSRKPVTVFFPRWIEAKCRGCRTCVAFCRFHALAVIAGKIKQFPQLCHGCGGCALFCPHGAMVEGEKIVGRVDSGRSGSIGFMSGILREGETAAAPVINQVLKAAAALFWEQPVLLDCPPGSGCLVMECAAAADYCLLVTEPTRFGVHNLDMIVDLVKRFDIPLGVIINQSIPGSNPAREYCRQQGLSVLGEIPYDHVIAAQGSRGKLVFEQRPQLAEFFQHVWQVVEKEVRHAEAAGH